MFYPLATSVKSGPLVGRPLQFNAAAPLAFGLSYLRAFDAGGVGNLLPLYSRWPQVADWAGFKGADAGVVVPGPAGVGISVSAVQNSGTFVDGGVNSNKFLMGSPGSFAMFTTIGFSPTDGVWHQALRIGANSGNSLFDVEKFSDNNWYMGWVDGGGTGFQASGAASGTYNAGDAVILGCAWNSTTTFCYVKGVQVASHASPGTFPSLNNGIFQINGTQAQNVQFARDTKTIIYWVALWDRQLAQSDFQTLQGNPYALFAAQSIPAVEPIGPQPVTGSVNTLKKNVAGQNVTFGMISAATGVGLTGLSINVYVTKDNNPQTAGAGTVTECGHGQYNYAPTQAETNATDVGFLFTATGAVPDSADFHTAIVDVNSLAEMDIEAIHGITLGARDLGISTQGLCWGTVGNGSTTTSVVVSSLNNPSGLGTFSGQLIGRTLVFVGSTTTASLQSSYASVTGSTTGATPVTLTVTSLPAAPVNGDTFVLL